MNLETMPKKIASSIQFDTVFEFYKDKGALGIHSSTPQIIQSTTDTYLSL